MNIDSYFICGVSDYKNNRKDEDLLYSSKDKIALSYTQGRHYASWLENKGLLDYPITDELVAKARDNGVFA